MATVHDVAAAIVSRFDRAISTMKLQKLVYLTQGWSLALRNRRMFEGRFEAWTNGPVNRDLFRNHRREFSVGSWPLGNPSTLTDDERVIVDAVIENYGALSGKELSDLTHVSGTPWALARDRVNALDGQAAGEPLHDEEIQAHFRELLVSGARDFRPGA